MLTNRLQDGQLYIEEKVVLDLTEHVVNSFSPSVKLVPMLKDRMTAALQKNYKRGIHVSVEDTNISLKIKLSYLYGQCIPNMTITIQNAVKTEIEEITGFTIETIDVVVEAIHFED
ncbi:Asp23/Gls24 family envelope stress response protein [Bacillus alkalicellulosilyticus]|uniref:Asp23/Gls24 family envelope stress response protein n=1 Tax=Alkalihalobacterium alkalicellulosilyticum TaxID=1912214 RepID=UPI0009979CBA|nr:Asp23/Gls24 family envelope stress response protein [Bacillus alkalicellulosilyticus]